MLTHVDVQMRVCVRGSMLQKQIMLSSAEHADVVECMPSSCALQVSITIPNHVTEIDGYAFMACISLRAIVIPDSVVSVADTAFFSLLSLTSVVISDSVTSSLNGGALPRCTGYGFRA